jgi:hypothetical protein
VPYQCCKRADSVGRCNNGISGDVTMQTVAAGRGPTNAGGVGVDKAATVPTMLAEAAPVLAVL